MIQLELNLVSCINTEDGNYFNQLKDHVHQKQKFGIKVGSGRLCCHGNRHNINKALSLI
jgi:hypothetical protein